MIPKLAAILPKVEDTQLVIRVLGSFSLTLAGQELPIVSRKAKALLAYLALIESGSETRERLVGLLWSNTDEEHARGSLRQALRELRNLFLRLGYSGFITSKTSVLLHHSTISVDLHDALDAAEAGEVHPSLLNGSRVLESLLLEFEAADPAFRSWLLARRHSIQTKISVRFEDRLRSALSGSAEALRYARALMALDPTHEEAAREIIRAKIAMKDIGGALNVYRALWNTLDVDYDVEPSTETQQLVARIKLDQPLTQNSPFIDSAAVAGAAIFLEPQLKRVGTPIIGFDDFDISGLNSKYRYIVQGFRRELIARMVRFREWRIRDSQAAQLNGTQDADKFDEYIVEASAFDSGDAIRLAMLLRNRRTGIYHWSERVTVSTENWAETLQGILRRLASVLNVHISAARIEALASNDHKNPTALDLWLRGQAASTSWSKEGCGLARSLFEESIQKFPDFAPAYSSLAQLQNSIHFWQPGTFRGQETERAALSFALEAVRLDPMDSRAHLCLGWAYAMAHRHKDAATHHALACELNENDAWTALSAALGAASRADFAQALHLEETAKHLMVEPNKAHWGYSAQIAFLAGQYERCAIAGAQAGAVIPSSPAWRIAALGHLGWKNEAHTLIDAFLTDIQKLWHGAKAPSAEEICRWVLHLFPFANKSDWQKFKEGLAKAGLPVRED